jgi:hypothetical protein
MPEQIVRLDRPVGLPFLRFCVRADTFKHAVVEWVDPLEIPKYPILYPWADANEPIRIIWWSETGRPAE